MFKKIIFLFICSFLLYIGGFLINLKAASPNKIYLEVGCNPDVTMIDDCIIIGGNINFNLEGSYILTYFNTKTKSSFDLEYIVVGKGVPIDYYEELVNLQYSNMEVYATSALTKDGVTIVAFYYYDHSKLNSLNDKKAMISVIVGDKVKSTITYGSYSEVVKLTLSEVGFIALVNYDEKGKTHFMVKEYNLEGAFLREVTIASNTNDIAKDIFLDNKYIYLIFNSASSNAPYIARYSGVSCAFIVKIDYLSFQEVNYVSFGNNTSNNILDCLFYNDNLYIIFKPFGSGDYLKKLSGSKFIVEFNKDLVQIKYLEVDNDDGYFGVSLTSDDIIIYTATSQSSNKIKAKMISYELKKVDEVELFIYNPDYTLGKITSNQTKINNIFVVSGRAIEDDASSILGIIKLEDGALSYQDFFIKGAKCLAINDLENVPTIYISKENTISIYHYYEVKEEDNSYLVNNDEANTTVISDTYLTNLKYGLNQKTLRLDFGNSYLYKTVDYQMPIESSIEEGEIYEIGKVIEANGDIYLGDKRIENGYKITKEGDYLLKVYGSYDVITYIEFRVEAIVNEATLSPLIRSESMKVIDLDSPLYDKTIATISDINCQSNDQNRGLSQVTLAIIIATFFIISALVIPFRKKKVGNNG